MLSRLLVQLKHPRLFFYNLYHLVKSELLKVLGHRAIWKFANGIEFYQDQLIGFQILRYMKENYHEPEVEKFFTEIIKKYDDGVFIDVGAAGGYYSFLAKKLQPKIEIHAFNPSPVFQKMMTDNMTLNKISDIHIHKIAISDQEGFCNIEPGWGGKITSQGNIPMTTITKFLNELNKDCFLIKIDIQGHELAALEGAKEVLGRIKNIIMESHTPEIHSKCLGILKSHDFKIDFESFEVVGQPSGLIVAKK